MNGRRLLRAIDQLHNLPTLPHVAVRLLRLASDDRSDVREIAVTIENDQTLSAKLLRWVNSAATGLRYPVLQVSRAITLLGMEAVRQAALSVQFFDLLHGKSADSGLPAEAFWRHCLGVAHAAGTLASHVQGLDRADAFTAGLLHDLGKLALACIAPEPYKQVLDRVADGEPILSAEKQCLGMDHTAAGRRLAQRWGLPPELANVIWLHHQPLGRAPEGTSGAQVVPVVWLADTLCREVGMGFSGTPRSALSAGELAQAVGIAPEAVADLSTRLGADVDSKLELLGLGVPVSDADQVGALSSANRHLGDTNEELRRTNAELRRREVQWRLLEHVHRYATSQDLGEVLSGVARAWQEGLGASACVCFATPDNPRCVEAARWPADPPDQAHFVIELPPSQDTRGAVHPPGDSELLKHLTPYVGDDEFVFLPLTCGTTRVGGLV